MDIDLAKSEMLVDRDSLEGLGSHDNFAFNGDV
jgi:hypothetical protein